MLLSAQEEQCLLYASLANLNYTLGRNQEVIRYIDKMLSAGAEKDAGKLICIKRYLSLCAQGYTPEKIREVLEYFHQKETVEQLFATVEAGKNLMDPFVANCDLQCGPECRLHGVCMKKRTEELVQFINQKQKEVDHSVVGKKLAKLLQKQ